jgi:hypothetical protein
LSSPDAKIRLYEVMNHKIQKEYKETELTGRIQEFMTLYAEVNLCYDLFFIVYFLVILT